MQVLQKFSHFLATLDASGCGNYCTERHPSEQMLRNAPYLAKAELQFAISPWGVEFRPAVESINMNVHSEQSGSQHHLVCVQITAASASQLLSWFKSTALY